MQYGDLRGSIRLILGYWFADSEKALMQQVTNEGWIEYTATQKKNEIKDVYGIIRMEQKNDRIGKEEADCPFFHRLKNHGKT